MGARELEERTHGLVSQIEVSRFTAAEQRYWSAHSLWGQGVEKGGQ